jgi:AcrR family transcriptional regulator
MPKPPSSAEQVERRKYSGLSAQERASQRRLKLLEAAREVFGRLGFAQTTMRNVCVQARLAERYFYESFSGTRELFDELLKLESRQMMAVINEALQAGAARGEAVVAPAMRAFLGFVKEDPRRVQIILIDGVWLSQMRARADGAPLATYSTWIRSLAQAAHPDLRDPVDVDMAAASLVGAAVYAAIEWARHDFAVDIDTVWRYQPIA